MLLVPPIILRWTATALAVVASALAYVFKDTASFVWEGATHVAEVHGVLSWEMRGAPVDRAGEYRQVHAVLVLVRRRGRDLRNVRLRRDQRASLWVADQVLRAVAQRGPHAAAARVREREPGNNEVREVRGRRVLQRCAREREERGARRQRAHRVQQLERERPHLLRPTVHVGGAQQLRVQHAHADV